MSSSQNGRVARSRYKTKGRRRERRVTNHRVRTGRFDEEMS